MVFAALMASTCVQAQETAAKAKAMTPVEAIQRAADDPVNGVTGVFEFTVQGATRLGYVFLNSEKDYRDQRCLTVRLSRGNAATIGRDLGFSLHKGLIGKRIRVTGTARRVRIDISESGSPTGLYYYQTHIYVDDPGQIQVLDVAYPDTERAAEISA